MENGFNAISLPGGADKEQDPVIGNKPVTSLPGLRMTKGRKWVVLGRKVTRRGSFCTPEHLVLGLL